MPIEFKLPELGENIETGDLVRLMVSEGETVNEGQPVMELETDKAVIEVPSSVSGKVKELRVHEGEKVKVGSVIFTVEGSDCAPARGATKAPEPAPKMEAPAPPKQVPAARSPESSSASTCRKASSSSPTTRSSSSKP